MALICGLGCLCPCPKCYVSWDLLSDLSQEFDLRTAELTQKILREASQLSAGGKEELLKQHGLREVEASLYFPELLALAYVWDIEHNF